MLFGGISVNILNLSVLFLSSLASHKDRELWWNRFWSSLTEKSKCTEVVSNNGGIVTMKERRPHLYKLTARPQEREYILEYDNMIY